MNKECLERGTTKEVVPDGPESLIPRSRILRKIDLFLLPMMFITYGFQFLDKAILGYAAVYSLMADNHLVGSDYSWTTSIFYFGYLVFEYPLTALLARFKIGQYLGFMVAVWGLTLLFSNFSRSFAGLAIDRFFLGGLESVIAPTFVIVTARWYTRQEQPIRQVIWFMGTPVFGIFGGLVGYAVGKTDYPAIASWRLLFIIIGGLTTVWGIILFFIFPSDPSSARFLSPEERVAASYLTTEQGTGGRGTWKWYQVREALIDPKTYFFLAIGFVSTIPAGALSGFASLLIKGFGFTAVQTQLIGIPSHVIQILSLIIGGVVSTKMKDMRLYAMSVCCVPPIIGTVLVHTLPTSHAWGRVVSLWLTYTNSVSLAVSFAVLGGNVTGFTKKNTVTFLLFVGYCSGSIASPQFFLSSEEARGYPTGIKTMIACFCIQLVLPLLLRVLYVNENKKRDALARDGEIQSNVDDDEDATDWERKTFRYLL
ncbi:MFS general substrate transporter [Hyaloscypha variabilis F]|uniref:MFS general substrate transporter n=1 Tax=Hyaloscypha variabilis (strain UAMH 11265 / GT02V1 / F) TaxID=1149755 RepID=A0A2J6SAW6_HYAVF|nr:MFS general substrate transporter [Hyaloscypha variabilis F]